MGEAGCGGRACVVMRSLGGGSAGVMVFWETGQMWKTGSFVRLLRLVS